MGRDVRYLFVLCILTLHACELDPDFKDQLDNDMQPIARFSFTTDANPCIVPCKVTFSNTSLHGQTYDWDFDDGNSSQSQNPMHTYQTHGTFMVTLTASNSRGSHDTTMTVVVKDDVPTFFKRFGGMNMDRATSVIESTDHFYLIAGYSNSSELTGGSSTDNLILWKFDTLGGKVWTLPKIAKNNSYGLSLIEDDAGQFVVVGYEQNTPGQPGVQTPLLVKYGADGTMLLRKDLDNPIHQFVTYTVITDIIDVGNQYAITGYSDLCQPGCPHILLAYLESNGTVIKATWSTDSFGGSDARGRGISKSPLRVVSLGDQDGEIIVRENPGINSMGLFDNEFPLNGAQVGNDLVGTSDGSFAIVGSTDIGSNGGLDVLFFVMNNNFQRVGNIINIGGPVSDFAQSIIVFENDYIIAGSSNSFSTNGNFDVYLIRITKSGTVVWDKTYDRDDGDEFAQEVIATSDGGFLVVGYTEFSNNTTDLFLLKTDENGDVN